MFVYKKIIFSVIIIVVIRMSNIAIFISGEGTLLKRIIKASNNGEINLKIKLVISSNESCNGVKIAQTAGINVISTNNESEIIERLQQNNIDFIILAGYLKLLPNKIVNKYPKRIINIHPSLLPSFGGVGMYGINVHKAVISSNSKISGATIHYVDNNFDTGAIIEQSIIEVETFETAESLQMKIQQEEEKLLIKVIKRKIIENG